MVTAGASKLDSLRTQIRSWSSVKQDILRHLKYDGECLATTMVDGIVKLRRELAV